MKRLIYIFVFSSSLSLSAQEVFEPFAGYDFESGDFTLLFEMGEEKGVFYTQDVHVLNAFKNSLKFDKEAVTYPFACHRDYRIVLRQNTEMIRSFQVSVRCEAFIGEEKGWWHFDGASASLALLNLDTAEVRTATFPSLTNARNALEQVKTNQGVVGWQSPEWEHYEGQFFFRYPNPNVSGRAPHSPWEKIREKVQDEVRRKFPGLPFDLSLFSYGYGENYPTLIFKIKTSKQVFEGFSLYPVSREWEAFSLEFEVYKKR